MDTLEELVYISIGHASMCWKERPKGEFDGAEADKVAKALLQGINEHVQNVIGLEQAKWHLSHPHIIRDANGQEIARSKGL